MLYYDLKLNTNRCYLFICLDCLPVSLICCHLYANFLCCVTKCNVYQNKLKEIKNLHLDQEFLELEVK